MINKSRRIELRLSQHDYDYLRAQATKAGMNMSQYLRLRLKEYEVPTPIDTNVSDVLLALGRIGNNINQIAREVNTYRLFDEGSVIKQMDELQEQIHTLRKRILFENANSDY